MIEKVIHYCWFGGKKKPKSVCKCIASWKKFFPDYEIKEWNEYNFNIECSAYCKEAYQQKKWAYVSDYARLYIIYNYGGIYFDTDVEVIKSFEKIVNQKFFLGMEDMGRINTGIGFGAEKNSPVIKAMLDVYDGVHFINSDGTLNPMVCPVYNTKALLNLGVSLSNENVSFMGGTIYKEEYFNPIGLYTGVKKLTENTHSIHHFDNSWMTLDQKFHKFIYRKFGKSKLYALLKKIKKVLYRK